MLAKLYHCSHNAKLFDIFVRMTNAFSKDDTIAAIATPAGMGGIAVIRMSGAKSAEIAGRVFFPTGRENKKVQDLPSRTACLGVIKNKSGITDEVLLTIFRAPNSYTGEDVAEISCHGSTYIQKEILRMLLENGARTAEPGEFTLRAFLNRRIDLSQAEAVADLIASSSASAHRIAIQQMRGGFSEEIKKLRSSLVHFASLIELELDFSEEDVAFADREQLKKLAAEIMSVTSRLHSSFELGNVIKTGIPVVIAGNPNVGKSTLLNALLNEERAITSEIPGTTRDAIEDELVIGGYLFRLTDTAGIRETSDSIESIGVSIAFEKISKSSVILYVFDVTEVTRRELQEAMDELIRKSGSPAKIIPVGNKADKVHPDNLRKEFSPFSTAVFLSAKEKQNLEELKSKILQVVESGREPGYGHIVSNVRHADALRLAGEAMKRAAEGLENGIPGDLLASDIRQAMYQLGLISGEITTDNLLENIFSRFCIGK